ncbi:MAG TPA: flagellar hook-associated protein FlgK [Thermoanaerobaculia bacterium]|jgi:flagellar hook-associated protein 1 FlgK|nr:flagellar hook-associated protein FlgK [Thermoanaerobaculia bacterium]
MSFFGINLASRSLQAHERMLEVTGQNIANANTPGYSRQVAILRSVSGPGAQDGDHSGAPLAAGGGVEVAQVMRSHAAWLDRVAASLEAQIGRTGVDARTSTQVEALLSEPGDAGLQATLDRFFDAFAGLASHPDDAAARDAVLRAGNATATRFQELTDGLDGLRGDMATAARENVAVINQLAQQVGDLNRVIGLAQSSGAAPNELLDQRDQLLGELTRRAGVTVSGQTGSDLIVSLGGMTLVQGEQVDALDIAPGTAANVILRGTGGAVTPGGELAAQQQWIDTALPDYRARIAAVRDGLAAAVNTLHQSGTDRIGAPGQAFFVSDGSGNLAVNPALVADRQRLVAGDGTAADGSVALAIAHLGSAPGSVLPGYHALVAAVGAQVRDSRQSAEQAQASRDQIRNLQASESGVNLDEELAQMVELQHSYAASARLLSAYDEMLSTLIQSTGG